MKIYVRLIRRCSVAAFCLTAVPFVGCSSSTEPLDTARMESAAKSEASSHSRSQKGLDELIADLDLRPEQKTEVDKLRTEAKERHAPIKAAKRELMGALADQIEKKGEVERCELAPQIDKIASAVAKSHPEDRVAFERFHAILDPNQRTKFVDAVRQRFQKKERAHGAEEMSDAISDKLDLSDEQEDRLEKVIDGLREIKEANPKHAERRERMSKILDAFKTETFHIDEIAPTNEKDVEAAVKRKVGAMFFAGEAVLPVLNEEQRETLAKFLRTKSTGHEVEEQTEAEKGGTARDEMPGVEEDD